MLGWRLTKDESGTSTVEFAVVAGIFFMLIIGIIEFGRLFYTHNALTDAARRGARYAVLHAKQNDDKCVKNVVIYGETHISDYPACDPPTGQPALINGLDDVTVTVAADYDPPTTYGVNNGTATVTITGYTFNLGIPFVSRDLNMPTYTTTLTAESAGKKPTDIDVP